MDNQCDFRNLDKSKRKQKIIDTAAELFHKKGYRSTSLDHISKELGITKAAIYHYISSKHEILSIIYIQVLQNIFKNINKILEKDIPPDLKLRLILRNHLENIIIHPLSMMGVFFSEETQLPEKEFRKIQKEKNKYNHIVEKIIEEGISVGIFRKMNSKLQAFSILGMCNWIYKWYKPTSSYFSSDQIVDHFISLLETGYLRSNKYEDSSDPELFVASSEKIKSEIKRQIYHKIKLQCKNLIELIDELEK